MTFNAGLLNTNLASDVIGQTKLDLATPVNIYNSLQANKRANVQALAQQKLSDLTLSTAEKEAKQNELYQKVMQNSLNPDGTVNAEKAIVGFNQNGMFERSRELQDRMSKVAKERQEAQKAQDEVNAQVGNAFLTAVESPNQIESFLNAQKEAKSRGWNMSQDLINYQPTSEEINTGKLNPKIQEGLKYYGERFLTPEQKLARQKAKDETTKLTTNKTLLEEFQKSFLPSISGLVKKLPTDESAKNQIAIQLAQSKFSTLPEAQKLIDDLKGKSSDQFAEGLIKMQLEAKKSEAERLRGGSYKPTQYDAAGFALRMDGAEKGLETLLNNKKFDPTTINFSLMTMGPESLKDGPMKEYLQYQRDFINATLRAESGAAIAESEFENAQKQYFPQPRDTPKVLEQKRLNRLRKQATFKAEAGGAWGEVSQMYDELAKPKKIGKYEVIK